MRRQLMCLVLFSVAVAVATLHYTEKVWATPAQGFVGTTLAIGRFATVDAFPALVNEEEHNSKLPSAMPKTKGTSDVYVESNVWQPGGSTGWHTHPGQSLIMVTEGAVTGYESNDPDCKAHVYAQGMGFVDPGGEHVHILRNEGNVVAKTITVQLIPAAAVRRIDVADPGNCHF